MASEETMWPESEPEIEPAVEPEGEPEPEVDVNPHQGQPSAEGQPIGNGSRPWYLRVDPEWKRLNDDVGTAWPIHTYFTGVFFAIIAIISIVHIARLVRRPKSQSKPYYITLHCLVFFCGVTRAVHFLVDPYNSYGHLPLVWAFITMNMYDPCMLSAFILVFMALVKVTRMRLITGGLFHPTLIACIIVVSFLIALTSDILVAYVKGSAVYAFVCHVYFVIWGMVASGFYTYLFCRIFNRIFMTRVKLNRMSRQQPSSIKTHEKCDDNTKDPVKKRMSPDGVYTPNVTSAVEGQGDSGECLPLHASSKDKECTQDTVVCDMANTGSSLNMEMSPDSPSCRYQPNSPISETSTLNAPLCSPQKSDKGSSYRLHFIPGKSPTDDASVPLVAKLVLLAASVFLLLSCLSFLSIIMTALRACEDEAGFPESWCWWLFQTTMRLLEMCMAGVIAVIAALPLYTKKKTSR